MLHARRENNVHLPPTYPGCCHLTLFVLRTPVCWRTRPHALTSLWRLQTISVRTPALAPIRPFLIPRWSNLKTKWRRRAPHVIQQQLRPTPTYSVRVVKDRTFVFIFLFLFCEPRTDLPFDHSPPCPVHLFHLNVLKVSYVEGLVHKGSRSRRDPWRAHTLWEGMGGACCMFPSRGRRLDFQAPDSAEGG